MKTSALLTFLVSSFAAVNAEHGIKKARHHDLVFRSDANETTHIGPLTKRGQFNNARWTFFDVGLGSCGKFSKGSDFIVALNIHQYGGGYPGPHCGETITMSYGGKTTNAKILDMCPSCPYGGLDLSRGLFDFFAPESMGVISGSWSFGGYSGGGDGGDDDNNDPPPPPPKPKTSAKPQPSSTTKDIARVKTSTKTSSSTSKSKTSSSTKASSTTINFNKGNGAGLAIPTGTPSEDKQYYQNALSELNQAIVQLGGLIRASS